jgi:hypothetical protein
MLPGNRIADVVGGDAIGLLFVLHEYQLSSGIISSRLRQSTCHHQPVPITVKGSTAQHLR